MTRMRADERRTLLVEAAIRAMARDGVAKSTTRSIVAEAGMALGAFHYCFRSKEDLVLEVMRRISGGSWTTVQETLGQYTEPDKKVRQAIAAYWSHLREHPHEHQLSYELTQWALRQAEDASSALRQYTGYISGMADLLTGVSASTGCTWRTAMPVLSRFTMAVIEGVTLQWLVDHDDQAAVATLDRLGDMLCTDLQHP